MMMLNDDYIMMMIDDDISKFHKIHIIVLNVWNPLVSPFLPSQGANVQSHCPPPICCPDLGAIIMRWDVKSLLTGEVKLNFRIPSTKNVHMPE